MAIFRAIILIISIAIWPFAYALKSIFVGSNYDRGFKLRRQWLKYAGYPMLGIRLDEVTGTGHTEPCIYVANHRSLADPFIISKYIDAFVVAKAEVGSYPIVNKGFEVTGVIYVQRDEKDSRKAVRKKMVEVVKSGHNILIYPEGTVGLKKDTLEFKPGAFYLAAENNISVVPIALEYQSNESLWKNPNLIKQFLYEFSKRKKRVKIRIGKPCYSTDGEEIRKYCFDWINNQLSEMQKGWSNINFEK